MYNFSIIRGDDADLQVVMTDDAGNAINITGFVLYFTVKAKIYDTDTEAVISKNVTSHADPTHGITNIILTKEDTDIEPKTYYYDIQVKDGNSKIASTEAGKLTIIADITRRTT